ncbi:MAG: hypothetical protein LBV54_04840, partial [Puniceicoccales bacterium]|nr:hypothetical protein [Puniceicoccales bacterium]
MSQEQIQSGEINLRYIYENLSAISEALREAQTPRERGEQYDALDGLRRKIEALLAKNSIGEWYPHVAGLQKITFDAQKVAKQISANQKTLETLSSVIV